MLEIDGVESSLGALLLKNLQRNAEITDINHASLLLGHTKSGITERVYPRWGSREAHRIGKVSEALAK